MAPSSIFSAEREFPDSVPDTMSLTPEVLAALQRRRETLLTPQEKVNRFWSKFATKAPGQAINLIPRDQFAVKAAVKRDNEKYGGGGQMAQKSYEEAAALCRAKVAMIVQECRRVNQKYRDPHFDLEYDLKMDRRDCLDPLNNVRKVEERKRKKKREDEDEDDEETPARRDAPHKDRGNRPGSGAMADLIHDVRAEGNLAPEGESESQLRPMAVKRVRDIFEDAHFFIDGPSANDVRQGRDGDCWLLAALCTLSNKKGLIEKVCVARDEDVGVYGFVFHRDGEWYSEIIDDKLYLSKPDYDEKTLERVLWEDRDRINSEEAYRKTYQTNSGALYFAQCSNPNETWLPLLEKAYAKAHGDYGVIEGGFTGEGIEDLTGGATSEIYTNDILDKEHFWKEGLMKVNRDFLFGCSTGLWGRGWGERKGIVELHAYSVMKAVEVDGVRLVLLKNPWGKHEWKGAWSNGSKEWTVDWMEKLDHKFGEDGSFWISYEDFLKKYQSIDRTRLFGPEWKVASISTTLNVPWTLEYHDTRFGFTLTRPGPVVVVLWQLDERYFRGLEGQYSFQLAFRIHRAGEDDYVVRSQTYYRMTRSATVELDPLEAGDYHVLVRIDTQRDGSLMRPEEVVRANVVDRREKLLRTGLAYDIAHSKGRIVQTPEEKAAREAYDKRKKAKAVAEYRRKLMEKREEEHYLEVKHLAKLRKRAEKKKARKREKTERKIEERERLERERLEKMKGEAALKDGQDGGEVKEGGESKTQSQDDSKQGITAGDAETEPIPEVAKAKGGEKAKSKDDDIHDGDESTDQGENTPSSSVCVENLAEGGLSPDEAEPTIMELPADQLATVPPGAQITAETIVTPRRVDETANAATKDSTPKGSAPPEAVVQEGKQSSSSAPGCPGPSDSQPPSVHKPDDSPQPSQPPSQQPLQHPPGQRVQQSSEIRSQQVVQPIGPPLPGDVDYPPSESDSDDDLGSISSVSDISDREIEIRMAEAKRIANQIPMIPVSSLVPPATLEEEDEFEKDPWNAVGVFGLRVYYKVTEEEKDKEIVKLSVVRPNPYSDLEEEKAPREGGKAGWRECMVLDVDDSAKDGTMGVEEADKKTGILPVKEAEDLENGRGESEGEQKAAEEQADEKKEDGGDA
ncbi:Calpain-1 catalytic subunit [Pleurostoma richardsiae]|uniref:Calpain-1 catalytic subunit n=1 Tax=Pleurostoma richardsiae TaxID=41990 RepID=A0AA38RSW5_9PEZI|nr:Calpain-1 catalytic subunit [Pleurostoma richardsiae]